MVISVSETPVNSLSLRSGFVCKDSKYLPVACTESQNSGDSGNVQNPGNVQHFKITFPETPLKQFSSRICDLFLFAHRYMFCAISDRLFSRIILQVLISDS